MTLLSDANSEILLKYVLFKTLLCGCTLYMSKYSKMGTFMSKYSKMGTEKSNLVFLFLVYILWC